MRDQFSNASKTANRPWCPKAASWPRNLARRLKLAPRCWRQAETAWMRWSRPRSRFTGQAVRYKARKNDKFVNLPVLPELQAFMGELKVQRADGLIAVRDDGTVWPSGKERGLGACATHRP